LRESGLVENLYLIAQPFYGQIPSLLLIAFIPTACDVSP